MVNTSALWDVLEKEFKGRETSCGSCLKQGVIGEDLSVICSVTPGMSVGQSTRCGGVGVAINKE